MGVEYAQRRHLPTSTIKDRLPRFALPLALVVVLAMLGVPVHATISSGQADLIWGQPDFHADLCNAKTPTASVLCGPMAAAVDTHGNLWVADMRDSRVLMYPADPATGRPSATPTKVFGQHGSFTTNGCNQPVGEASHDGAVASATDLCHPYGIAVDTHGTVYVADTENNRVLAFFDAADKPADAAADFVLGQPNFASSVANWLPPGASATAACPTPSPASPCTLSNPEGVSVDAQGDVLVTDSWNNRVLLWRAATLAGPTNCTVQCAIPASVVWGQGGSFATNGANGANSSACIISVTSASSLACPTDAIMSSQGDLVVADSWNNRVLEYDHASTARTQAATLVYGQQGSFASSASNLGGPNPASLHAPSGLAFDPYGNLWVADTDNSRVLEFPPPHGADASHSTTAITTLGPGLCTGAAMSASSLCDPASIAFDGSGTMYVADPTADRVLGYLGSGTPPTANVPTATPPSTPTPHPTATPVVQPPQPHLRIVFLHVQHASGYPLHGAIPSGTTLRVVVRVVFASAEHPRPTASIRLQQGAKVLLRRTLGLVSLGHGTARFQTSFPVRAMHPGKVHLIVQSVVGTMVATKSAWFTVRPRHPEARKHTRRVSSAAPRPTCIPREGDDDNDDHGKPAASWDYDGCPRP